MVQAARQKWRQTDHFSFNFCVNVVIFYRIYIKRDHLRELQTNQKMDMNTGS